MFSIFWNYRNFNKHSFLKTTKGLIFTRFNSYIGRCFYNVVFLFLVPGFESFWAQPSFSVTHMDACRIPKFRRTENMGPSHCWEWVQQKEGVRVWRMPHMLQGIQAQINKWLRGKNHVRANPRPNAGLEGRFRNPAAAAAINWVMYFLGIRYTSVWNTYSIRERERES